MDDIYDYDDFYKEVGAIGQHDSDTPGVYHYTRSTFDFANRERRDLVDRCAKIPDRFHMLRGDATAVYIIGPENSDYAKIGITGDVFGRLSGIQTGCWDRLKIHYCLCVYDDLAYTVEQSAIALAAFRGIEIRGEWVGVPAAKAFDFVLDAAEAVGALCADAKGFNETQKDMAASRGQSRRRMISEKEKTDKELKWARLGY